MVSEREKQESPIINPVRTISTLISWLPKDRECTVDTGQWSQALMWLRDQYENKYPEFFIGMNFRQRGLRVYSRDVDQTLTLLYLGNVVETIRAAGKTKMRLKHEVQTGLSNSIKTAIQEMSENLVTNRAELIIAT